MSIDGNAVMVIGVMPQGFEPPRFGWMAEQPLWIPFAGTEANRTWGRFLHTVARIKPGVSVDVARAELQGLDARRAAEGSGGRGWSSLAVPLADQITGDVRTPIRVLFGAVALLLVMSVVNVSALITAFARRREHEVELRRALGATAGRLTRQLLVEHSVLAMSGLALGVGFAWLATNALVNVMPATVPRIDNVRVTSTVVLFALVVTALATLVLTAYGAVRARMSAKSAETLAGARVTRRVSGSGIITAEVAIGMVLTIGATLMVRSYQNLRSVDLGYDPASLVGARVSLPESNYPALAQRDEFFETLLTRVRTIPGVTDAALVTTRPFACCAPATSVIDPANPPATGNGPTADIRYVDSAYFRTMRIPQLAGADFGRMHVRDGDVLAVVSRSMANALWGEADPIGRAIAMKLNGETIARVIGVVGNVQMTGPRTAPRPTVYVSTLRYPSRERDLVVRGSREDDQLIEGVRSTLATIDESVLV
jgi:predicted permease